MSWFRKWRLLVWEQRVAARETALDTYEAHVDNATDLNLVIRLAKAREKRTHWRLKNGLGTGL
jgi:hypothetical protein